MVRWKAAAVQPGALPPSAVEWVELITGIGPGQDGPGLLSFLRPGGSAPRMGDRGRAAVEAGVTASPAVAVPRAHLSVA